MHVTSEYETTTTNGAAVRSPSLEAAPAGPTLPLGPRLPRRELWLELPQEEYPGFRIKLWVNYPRRLNSELSAGSNERMLEALQQIVLEHNGWLDIEGEPLPPATSAEFWQIIPDELAAAVIALLGNEVGKLASSLVPTRRR